MRKLRIGDTVKVLTGDYVGKTGDIISFVGKDRIIVDGINIVKKHVKKGVIRRDAPGQIIEIPAPIHISNVMVVCPVCGKATKIAISKKNGKKARICKKCGAAIDFDAKNIVKKAKAKASRKAKKTKDKTKDNPKKTEKLNNSKKNEE